MRLHHVVLQATVMDYSILCWCFQVYSVADLYKLRDTQSNFHCICLITRICYTDHITFIVDPVGIFESVLINLKLVFLVYQPKTV